MVAGLLREGHVERGRERLRYVPVEDVLRGFAHGEELRPDGFGDVGVAEGFGGGAAGGEGLAGWDGEGEETVAVAGLRGRREREGWRLALISEKGGDGELDQWGRVVSIGV